MDETNKTIASATPEVTAASITPTAPAGVSGGGGSETKTRAASKKKGGANKATGEQSFKGIIDKLESIRIEMNDVSTWTEMIATDITGLIPQKAAAAPQGAGFDPEIFQDVIGCLTSIDGAVKASASIAWDLYPMVQNIQNDVAAILRVFANELELADMRRQQEEENRREMAALLEKIAATREKETEDKKKGKSGDMGIGDWLVGLAGLAAGFVSGLIAELTLQFKGIIKAIKESRLAKSIGAFIDNVVLAFERGWSKLKAFSRIMTDKAAKFIERIQQFASRLFEPVVKLFERIKESPFGKKIAEMFDRLSAIGERFISKFKAGLRLIEESKFFKAIESAFVSAVEFIKGIGTKIKGIGTSVKNFFTWLVEGWSEVTAAFGNVGKKLEAVIDFVRGGDKATESIGILGRVMKWFTGFWESLKGPFKVFFELGESLGALAGKVFGFLGKLMAKIAIPLTIIMSLWDFFKGYSETEGDFLDKFKGGFIELVNGLVGWIIDIPKSIVSWIAGALGFKEVEKALDSFNFKDILVTLIDVGQQIFEDFFQSVVDLFSGDTMQVISNIGQLIADIYMAPYTLIKGLASWIASALGFDKLSEWLDNIDLGKMLFDGVKSVVGMITDFFQEQWSAFKGIFTSIGDLLTGKLDFGTFFKSIVAGLIKLLLAPVNTIGKWVGFDITKKALELLGLDSNSAPGASGGAATSSAVEITPAPNTQGAVINEIATSTQAIKDEAAASSNSASLVDASKNTNITNNNQSVSYAGPAIPDRTASMFMPRFGY